MRLYLLDVKHRDRRDDIALLSWQEFGEMRRAEALLRRAADAGSVHAMSTLGVLLQQMNLAHEAEVWLRSAAASGDADAISNLGFGGGTRRIALYGRLPLHQWVIQ